LIGARLSENQNSIVKFANRAIPLGHELTKIVRQMNHKIYGTETPQSIKMQYGTFIEDMEQYDVFIEALNDEFYVFFNKQNKIMYLLECSVSDIGHVQIKGGTLAGFIE
jgi:hypothetical protein